MREALRQAFLVRNDLGDVACPLLAGDASFRKYYRLHKNAHSYVLMDAPPPHETTDPFVQIANLLIEQGFSAPRILDQDRENGFILLEDLGDDTYTRLLARGGDETQLYELATDVLIALHHKITDLPETLPTYDPALLTREADLFIDYWMAAAFEDDGVSDRLKGAYQQVWQRAFQKLADAPPALVLRDYHVDNMLYLPDRSGVAQCGLLDFQDAVIGTGAYDLVSLLEDARRDIDPELAQKMKKRYLNAFPTLDRDAFEASYAILGAQRHAKVIGIFVRLCVRDNKPVYLHHIPRVWRLFERALNHPVLHEVQSWIETHVPKETRGIPSCLIARSNRE